ncbi:exo-beta-N-acetylmuramidase NamZ domain-containing protein [Horticoccus sp. 23ND18S-11]|uniref:exo-beta-N-acetylmuramidase NamZ domain-containing protein n=1 Tax=Horticoccus sp. 23ND18S-11 TaxID=3391832 RepID=UPI0039C969BF
MRTTLRRTAVAFLLFGATALNLAAAETFKADKLAAIDAAVADALAAKKAPGGVLWFEHDGKVHTKTYGQRALVPAPEPISADTIYDAASLTKVVATTTAVLQLVERNRLNLDLTVAHYIPEFAALGKEGVTVRQLLTHTSGLRPDLDYTPAWSGIDTAVRMACAEKLRSVPGSTFVYSDINFIVLGELVRLASGLRLDAYVAKEIFTPLKMTDSGFLPPREKLGRIAPTELTAGTMLRGVVHDPSARMMGGVAGHAGLFTTAADLARFCRMLLNGGELDGARILTPATVADMTRSHLDGSDRRGLGWDIDTRFSGPRGRWFPAGKSFGHTGWTGGSVWVDPGSKSFVIFLSNRVHPDGKGDVTPLRREIGTLAAEAIGRDVGAVMNGIDVLVREDFARLRGLKIGLITNHTGRDRLGRLTIDLLHAAKDVKLVALFSPEHGIRGAADDKVGDTIDEKTKLPVYSLYGDSPKRTPGMTSADFDMAVIRARAPKAEQLQGLDALVFDIQDIGARFYTYSATLGAAVEAAAKAKKKIFVLDRVNPIGGVGFEGPVQTRAPSFIGFHAIPVRHGMTLGELARLFNTERKFGADLEIVRCENWTRQSWYDDSGLPWVNPSPSMRSLTAATLYPGFCLLESTSVSMGRGTAKPFEQVGAPYIDGVKLAAELNRAGIPGVRFEAVKFTPQMAFYPGPASSLKYKDQECGGVRAILTDRDRCPVIDIGLELALAVKRLYPDHFKVEEMGRLLGDDETLNAIKAGESRATIKARWTKASALFEEQRRAALLY